MKSKLWLVVTFLGLAALVIMVWLKACANTEIAQRPTYRVPARKVPQSPPMIEVDFPGVGPVKGKKLSGPLEVREEEDQGGISISTVPAEFVVGENGNFLYLRNHDPNGLHQSKRRVDLGLKFLRENFKTNLQWAPSHKLKSAPDSFAILGPGETPISDPKVRRKLMSLVFRIDNIVELWGVRINSPRHGEIEAILVLEQDNAFVDPPTRDRLVWKNGVSRWWSIHPMSDDVSMYALAQAHVVEEWETPPENAVPGLEYGQVFEGEVLFTKEYERRINEFKLQKNQ